MLYSMPAIYIQLAGERTHFTLFPLLCPSSASLKLTRAFQVRNWHRLLGCHCVARATCHNCGHVCFDLQRTLRANAPKMPGLAKVLWSSRRRGCPAGT